MLIGVVWGIFGTGVRSFKRSERVSGAQLSALLAIEALERDLLSVFIDRAGVERPVAVDHGDRRLSFHRARSQASDLMRVYDETVIYEFPRVAGKPWAPLLRNGKAVRNVQILDGAFEFLPAGAESGDVHLLRLRLRCCDGRGQGDFALLRLFALDGPTRLWRRVKGADHAP